MKNGFKVMDSDMHIIEPPDLWQRYIDAEFKDQAPRGTTDAVADLALVGPDGTPWGRSPKNVRDFNQHRRGRSFDRNQERFKPYEEMGWTGEAQLRGMDAEGIDVAVIYPSRGLFALTVPDLAPPLAAAIARAYNNWLYDFCAPDRQRLLGAGMLSPFDDVSCVTGRGTGRERTGKTRREQGRAQKEKRCRHEPVVTLRKCSRWGAATCTS